LQDLHPLLDALEHDVEEPGARGRSLGRRQAVGPRLASGGVELRACLEAGVEDGLLGLLCPAQQRARPLADGSQIALDLPLGHPNQRRDLGHVQFAHHLQVPHLPLALRDCSPLFR
jgi:hypothetical protein